MKINMINKITILTAITTIMMTATACGSSNDDEVVEQLIIPEANPEEIIGTGSGDYNVPFTVTIETGEIFYFDLYSSEATVGTAIHGQNIAIIGADGTIESALHNEAPEGQSWNFYVDGYISEDNIMEMPIEEGREYAIVVE